MKWLLHEKILLLLQKTNINTQLNSGQRLKLAVQYYADFTEKLFLDYLKNAWPEKEENQGLI